MARRGDGIYQRGKTWWLDFRHDGQRHVVRLGKGINRTVAGALASGTRAAILKGEAGIGGSTTVLLAGDLLGVEAVAPRPTPASPGLTWPLSPPPTDAADAMLTYFIHDPMQDAVKIGRTRGTQGLRRRVSALQTAHGTTLVLLGVVAGDHAARFHAAFAPFRLRGEWFRSPALILEHLVALAAVPEPIHRGPMIAALSARTSTAPHVADEEK